MVEFRFCRPGGWTAPSGWTVPYGWMVGLFVAGSFAAGISRVAAEEAPAFQFVAYNVENYLKMSRWVDGEQVENAPKPEAEKASVVQTLLETEPEVIGLCEIGSMEDVEDLRERLAAGGLEYPYVEWVDAADPTRHLALLSQYEIVAVNSQRDLRYEIEDKVMAFQRGILDVTLQITADYRLRCVGVHFKSKREIPEAPQDLMRRNEAQLLREHVDAILEANPEENLLVYGDFNDTRNEIAVKVVQGEYGSPGYLSPIHLEDELGMTWTYHWSYADSYSRIDFIFFSRAMAKEIDWDRSMIHFREGWDEGSDHRALVATVIPVER